MGLSENNYLSMCEFDPFFQKIGIQHFEPKIWLVFMALKNGVVSQESVASNPCQSLMKHKITYDQIGRFLTELEDAKILEKELFPGKSKYHIIPKMAFELHKICYELSLKIKDASVLTNIIHECGYPSNEVNNEKISRFRTGGDNEKSEVIKELLSQIAYSGTDFILKCIFMSN